ncbi:hypothetical protein amrb99_29640 [Actinomadura sp. RB99]|jgi:hypothetical protein|nr:hypothetical protein [Actinomadura sp. RB99]
MTAETALPGAARVGYDGPMQAVSLVLETTTPGRPRRHGRMH